MTRAGLQKFAREARAWAVWRSQCSDPAGERKWLAQAEQAERMILTADHKDALEAMRRSAATEIRIVLDEVAKRAEAAQTSVESVADWAFRNFDKQSKSIVQAQEIIKAERQQKVAKRAEDAEPVILEPEHEIQRIGKRDVPGRIRRVLVKRGDKVIETRQPIYDDKGRITKTLVEKKA